MEAGMKVVARAGLEIELASTVVVLHVDAVIVFLRAIKSCLFSYIHSPFLTTNHEMHHIASYSILRSF